MIVILLCLLPAQSILLECVAFQGIKPDLFLWMVYLVGFKYGEWKGGGIGILSGLILDAFSPGRMGMNIFIKGLFGFCAGILGRNLLEAKPLFHFGMLSLFSFSQGILIYLILQINGEPVILSEVIGKIIVPQMFYDGIVGGMVVNLILMGSRLQRFLLWERVR